MHPARELLRLFAEQRLTDERECQEIETHVSLCEFCREYCDRHIAMIESIAESWQDDLPQSARDLGERIYRRRLIGAIIPLEPFDPQTVSIQLQMAADSEGKFTPDIVCLATLYSESPELVLRVMRDQRRGDDYLQLISDDPAQVSQVLIRAQELDREFLTDNHGRASFKSDRDSDLNAIHWQIKMPDATFSLEPLVYDPDRKEYANEILLETDRHDKIKVVFEGKTEGKLISIQVLQLNGRADFRNVRVSLLQDQETQIKTTEGMQKVSFDLKDQSSMIGIRLFATT